MVVLILEALDTYFELVPLQLIVTSNVVDFFLSSLVCHLYVRFVANTCVFVTGTSSTSSNSNKVSI